MGNDYNGDFMGIMYFILIRGRNCEKYLKTCLKSLQAQTYQNWRAMVVLDAPEDDSYQIALPYEGNKYIFISTKAIKDCAITCGTE